tara:strand:+ start:1717 stop:2076 length:360 start_codon:yes stop_codon:yes gene_type:complete
LKESKPYIQKAYEKFAMMTKIQLETFLEHETKTKKVIEGQIAVMKASGKVCLVITNGEGSLIPFAVIMSEEDSRALVPDFESLDPMTKLFYGALKNDKRKKLEDYDKAIVMDEFKEYYK